jgi:hypothetical protein
LASLLDLNREERGEQRRKGRRNGNYKQYYKEAYCHTLDQNNYSTVVEGVFGNHGYLLNIPKPKDMM